MSNWKRDGWSHYLINGECHAAINMLHDRNLRRDTISATVRTPLFPKLEQNEFSTIAEAKTWCEQWLAFAEELLYLRKTVEALREEAHKDFTENLRLRDELHNYRYPHVESEVSS